MTEELEIKVTTEVKPKITVDYQPGQRRWGKVFHLFDIDGREISLHQKDAIKLAKAILIIAKEKK